MVCWCLCDYYYPSIFFWSLRRDEYLGIFCLVYSTVPDSTKRHELTRHLETRCLRLPAIDALSCSFFAVILYSTSYAAASLEEKQTNKQTFSCAHGKVFICQGCKRLEAENYNRLVGMFSLREYLFWFLYLPPSYVPGARLAQLVEHETLTWVRAPRWALRAYFCDLFQSTLCLICSTALNWILF